MSTGTVALAQWATWCAAFWTVVLQVHGRVTARRDAVRVVAALGLGACCAYLGTAIVGPSRTPTGFSVLFVPLGVLIASLATGSRAARVRFLQLTLPALPMAFAVARVGCIIAGCCGPREGATTHPALYEILGLVTLHVLLGSVEARARPAAALVGFGAVRLGLEPLRIPTADDALLGAPFVAGAWVVAGLALAVAQYCPNTPWRRATRSIHWNAAKPTAR